MLTLHEAAAAIRAGQTTPPEVLETCLSRLDRYEERVRAWVFVDRDGARAEARRLAEELRRGQYRGPLHGVPVGIKDIFDVFDWPTACGSKLWAHSVARQDATTVQRLRRAGAVFVGKTVTTQFASFDPPVTRNPWNPERTPGGSSSGSAAALACGMVLGALGSQTGGSITRPAAYCGVAGCKPTYGRVPATGVMPLAASMDHPGPMARCVTDLAILLQVLAGPDHADPTCVSAPVPNYLEELQNRPARPRLGRLRGLFDDRAEPGTRDFLDRTLQALGQKGADCVEVALPAAFAEVIPRHRTVMSVEALAFHEPRLQRHPEDYERNIRSLLDEGVSCPAVAYARSKEHQKQLTAEILSCFAAADFLVTPAATGPAPGRDTTGDPAFNAPWSYTGLPTVSIPAGRSPDGLPLSLQLIGPPWSEGRLLAAAAWCEEALGYEVGLPG